MARFLIERRLHDRRRHGAAANVDRDRRPLLRPSYGDIARPDRIAQRGTHGAAPHFTAGNARAFDAIPMARDAASVVGHEADELARDSLLLLPDECIASDEVALGELDEPAEVGLEGRGGVVDVVAVERHPHLEAERVAGAESRRRHASRADERFPDRRRITIVEVELEAVLAGVAGAGDDARAARDDAFGEVVVADLREVAPGERLENRRRLGALEREERD